MTNVLPRTTQLIKFWLPTTTKLQLQSNQKILLQKAVHWHPKIPVDYYCFQFLLSYFCWGLRTLDYGHPAAWEMFDKLILTCVWNCQVSNWSGFQWLLRAIVMFYPIKMWSGMVWCQHCQTLGTGYNGAAAQLWSWSSVTGVMLRYVSRINCDYIMLFVNAFKNFYYFHFVFLL